MSKTVLITGISGFLAHHCAIEFLRHGYTVRGTLRSLAKSEAVKEALAPHVDIAHLEFCEADLTEDIGWHEAVSGCDYVAHLASPFPLNQPDNEDDLVIPAVEGTLRVMNAAKDAGGERFIQTSSTAAIAYGHPHNRPEPFTEADWTDVHSTGITAYVKSKTLAEQAARDFIAQCDGAMSYASVNPGFILGPIVGKEFGASAALVQMMLGGKYPGVPKICMFCIDVRDVAACHRLAIEQTKTGMDRFMVVEKSLWFVDLATALSTGLGEKANRVPTRQLPTILVKIVALFNPAVRSILPEIGNFVKIDSSATQNALNITFRKSEDAIIATAHSLIERGKVS